MVHGSGVMLSLLPLGHFFIPDGSVSHARVTPLFLAVTAFRVLIYILDIYTKSGG